MPKFEISKILFSFHSFVLRRNKKGMYGQTDLLQSNIGSGDITNKHDSKISKIIPDICICFKNGLIPNTL